MERSIEALLKLCMDRGMGRHPFLRLTAELPVDMGVLYDFMSNLNLATSAYPAWLQTSCARVPSPKIRSILFKLLNDEYGSGDPEQIHVNLFDDMLGALRPWQLPLEAGEALRPGRELRARAEAIFNARDPYEGLGVVISERCPPSSTLPGSATSCHARPTSTRTRSPGTRCTPGSSPITRSTRRGSRS